MNHDQLAEALVAWVVENVPEIEGEYPYPVDQRTEALPDVGAEILEIRYATTGEADSMLQQVQQVTFQTFDCEIILVVPPDPAESATRALEDFTQKLADAVKEDDTLGGRVQSVLPNYLFRFRPAYVEFEDGSRGRLAVMSLRVTDVVQQ